MSQKQVQSEKISADIYQISNTIKRIEKIKWSEEWNEKIEKVD